MTPSFAEKPSKIVKIQFFAKIDGFSAKKGVKYYATQILRPDLESSRQDASDSVISKSLGTTLIFGI